MIQTTTIISGHMHDVHISLNPLTAGAAYSRVFIYYPANAGHSPNAVSMLGQRRRRCANIETSLGECAVFAG